MIKVNTMAGRAKVEMTGSWAEIDAGVHAVMEAYYNAKKADKGETHARAKNPDDLQ